ncbi:MAG: hypothetical protein FJ038_03770 [Chloroflexi bacterium]|nr:hypothetical protein [Chloroflexota bacterium]
MSRLISLYPRPWRDRYEDEFRLISLYPRPWRDRYEDEFRVLISGRQPSTRERLDIVRGAIDARLHPQVPGAPRDADRFGFAALAGLAAFVAALVIAANGPVHSDAYGTYRDGSAAVPVMMVATFLLSISVFRVVMQLPTTAIVGQSAGVLACVVLLFWPLMFWVMPVGVVVLVSVMLLAVSAHRPGIWPMWLSGAMVAVLTIPAGLMAVLAVLPWYTARELNLNMLILVGPMAAIWLLVGIGLLRGVPRRPAP